MGRSALPYVVASALASCTASPTGTLEIGPVEDGRAFSSTYVPIGSPPDPGQIYLEFQTVDATLLLEGSTASNHGCLPLPSTLKLVVLTGSEGLPPGARVRVSAWAYEAPEAPKGSAATTMVAEVPISARCTGTLVTDATYSVPYVPDAGVEPDATPIETDAGFHDTGATPDSGVAIDATFDDATFDDATFDDAGTGMDAELADTSTTTSTVTDGG